MMPKTARLQALSADLRFRPLQLPKLWPPNTLSFIPTHSVLYIVDARSRGCRTRRFANERALCRDSVTCVSLQTL